MVNFSKMPVHKVDKYAVTRYGIVVCAVEKWRGARACLNAISPTGKYEKEPRLNDSGSIHP